MTNNEGRKPLSGLRVLDLSRFLAGPYCTMLLGDYGAEVIKVEPPNGDPTRLQGPPFVDGEGLTFLSTNRNKSSMVADFNAAADLEKIRQLAMRADVLVENFRPDVLSRFGLDYESLRQGNPRLIYGSISGFGATGPMAKQGAFDLTIQAVGGYMSITGEPGSAPVKLGTSAIDMLAGMNLFSGILLALVQRGVKGAGQLVQTSLLESQVALLSNAAFEHLLGVGDPKKMGSEHPQLVPYKAFRTSDGWIVVGAGAQNLFERLARVLGTPEMIQDERSRDLAARVGNREFVNAEVERETVCRTTAELVDALTSAGVPCAPVLSIKEVFNNEQVLARNMVVQMNATDSARATTLGTPVKYSSFEVERGWSAPPRLNVGGDELAAKWLAPRKEDSNE